jgi:hypothetical protein
MTDLASQQVVWSEDASSTQRPEVVGNGVFVAQTDGKLWLMKLAQVKSFGKMTVAEPSIE